MDTVVDYLLATHRRSAAAAREPALPAPAAPAPALPAPDPRPGAGRGGAEPAPDLLELLRRLDDVHVRRAVARLLASR